VEEDVGGGRAEGRCTIKLLTVTRRPGGISSGEVHTGVTLLTMGGAAPPMLVLASDCGF